MKKLTLIIALVLLVGIIPPAYAQGNSPIEYDLAKRLEIPENYILVRCEGRFGARFSEGLCPFDVSYPNGSERLIGYMDALGNVVIAPRFSYAGAFSDGLAFVRESGSKKGGYIDITGKYVLPPVFDYGYEFKDGKTLADFGGYYCVIDKKGQALGPVQYANAHFNDELQRYVCLYNDGYTDILDENYQVEKTFAYSFGYFENSIVYSINDIYKWDGRIFASFNSGENRYSTGILDYETGKVIIPPSESGRAYFENGMFIVWNYGENTTQIYDIDGKLKTTVNGHFVYENGALISVQEFGSAAVKVCDLNGNIKLDIENLAQVTILSETMYWALEFDGNPYADDFDYTKMQWYFYNNGVKQATNLIVEYDLSGNYFQVRDMGIKSMTELEGVDIDEWSESRGDEPNVGVVDKTGKIIVPTKYEQIHNMQSENGEVFIAVDGDTMYFYNESGKLFNTIYRATMIRGYSSKTRLNIRYLEGKRACIDALGNTLFSANNEGVYLYEMDELGNIRFSFEKNYYFAINKTTADLTIPKYEPFEPVKLPPQTALEDKTIFLQVGSFKKFEDGKFDLFDNEVYSTPIISNSRTLVPVRMVSECFEGSDVLWDSEARSVEVKYGTRKINLDIDSNIAQVSGFDFDKNEYVTGHIEMEVPAQIINDRTYIPLRAVTEALGFDVYWGGNNGLIGVGTQNATPSAEQIQNLVGGFEKGIANVATLKRMDASLATQPYLQYIAPRILGIDTELSEYYAEDLIEYTNTIPAYEALIAGKKDLILVTEPSPEILDLAKEKGVELEIIPFSKEGFVFLVNTQNPVNSLTQQQVRDIYQDKITNWNQVGGPDLPITAYQRNVSSGSQTIMENVFMKGLTMPAPLTRKVESMAGLVDRVAEFDEDVNGGIGYSVYYYASQMYTSPNIKLLALDGIMPTVDTIRDNSYPAIVNYYVVKRKDDNSVETKKLLDFVMSTEGQSCVNESGLVSIR